ncbi:hypothetical protein PGB90_000839 [Kerria lacca]
MISQIPSQDKDHERFKKWIHAVKRKDFKPTSNAVLCSLHFKESNYYPSVISGNLMLKKDAIPSVFSFPDHLQKKLAIVEYYSNEIEIDNSSMLESGLEISHCDVAVQTELTSKA